MNVRTQIIDAGPSGIRSQLSQVPECAGIYAWHKSYRRLVALLEGGDLEEVCEALFEELARPHLLTRSRLFSELGLEVSLSSNRKINKKSEIKKALRAEPFRRELMMVLRNAHLWQQPLYIGKAADLRDRLRDHLRIDSPLRQRLEKEAGINIDHCSVRFVEVELAIHAGVLEEIASRLFLPPFSKRLG